jgi:hypothetical protein
MPRFGRFRDVAVRLAAILELALFLKSCALAAVLVAATCSPVVAAQPREQVAAAVDRYLALREVAFSTHPEDVEVQARPGEERVYGVIVEYQVEDALVTVVGFASGDASVYRSTGGGKIGGRGEPLVASAAWSLVKQAQVQLTDLPLVKAYPTPEPGHVRIYALTTAGLRGAEENRADIQDARDRLAPLFAGGRKIVSEFQAAAA